MKKLGLLKLIILTLASASLAGCNLFTKAVTITSIEPIDERQNDYVVGDIFDNYINNGGLKVKATKSDGSSVILAKQNFTYKITCGNDTIDGTTPFTTTGSYSVNITKDSLVKSLIITVSEAKPYVTSIAAKNYTKDVPLNYPYTFDGTVTATYSDHTKKDVTDLVTLTPSVLDTTTLGYKNISIQYVEGKYTVSTTISINVIEQVTLVTSVSVTPTSKSIIEKESFSLASTVMPADATNKTLSWTSTNEDVCVVDQTGKISAKTVGSATIKAVATDGSGKYGSCQVTVVSSKISVTGITLSPTSKSIEVDQSYQINATVKPDNATNKELTWTSSNSAIAEVVDGLVTAKAAGSATITATAKDGSKVKATSSVTVTAKKVLVESITFNSETLTINKGYTKTLTATVLPSNADNKTLTWSTTSSSVATVTQAGVVKGVKEGTATIKAYAKDGSGVFASCEVTITAVTVTSISLPSTAKVTEGKTTELTVTYIPSDATVGKSVSWSSSKTSIATVSSTGVVTGVAVGTAVITATSTTDASITASCTVTVSENKGDAWTIMIYMCGADLESDYGQASTDIREILAVSNQPDDVNIIIQTGGSRSWSLSSTYLSGATSIPSTQLGRWHVENKKLVKDEFLTNASMGKTSTYQSFLTWGLTNYPAQKTGVVLWNHGGGLDGVCFDEKYSDDALLNSEMQTAHKNAIGSSKLDFIGFDACLMQCADIADFNSKYFNYQVASQESENGSGWYYTNWIDNVYNNDSALVVCKEIVDTFISSQGTSSDQTLSCLDLSYASEFNTAWEAYASALKSKFSSSSVNKSTFASWAKSNIKNYSESGYCGYGQFDVTDWLNKIGNNSTYNPGSTYKTNVVNVLNNYVAYSKKGSSAGNSNGLCVVYCCSSNVEYSSGEYAFSNWASFNSSYGL